MKLSNLISKITVNNSTFKDTGNGIRAIKSVVELANYKAA